MRTFDDFFKEQWAKMSFWDNVDYKWTSFWNSVECYYQLFMWKVFKVDWHKDDEKEDGEYLCNDCVNHNKD